MQQSVHLTDSQIMHLRRIFAKRLRIWRVGFSGSLLLYFLTVNRVYPKVLSSRDPLTSIDTVNREFLIIIGCFILGLILCFCLLYFFKLKPLRRDIQYAAGINFPLHIIRKSFFPYVNRYFLFLDDDKFQQMEVDESEFNRYAEGDQYVVTISARSGILLDDFYNYDLI